MRRIPDFLPSFIKRVEGFRLESYRDSAGVWTIGVGHTGPEVHAGLRWTVAQVDRAVETDLKTAAARLYTVVKPVVIAGMTEHQYAALLSFVFNMGANSKWTLWKVTNAGEVDAVPTQLLRFTKARDPKTGKLFEVTGLVNRRMAEVALWKTADEMGALAVAVAGPDDHESSGYTRSIETPPEPMATKPLRQSKSFMTSCLTACVSAGGAASGWLADNLKPVGDHAKQGAELIAPLAAQAEPVGHIHTFLITAAAVVALAVPVFIGLKNYKSKVH